MPIAEQNREVIYTQPNGKFTGIEALSLDKHGMDDTTDNTIPTQTVLFGRDSFGRPKVKLTFDDTPSGLVTGTINFNKQHKIDFLEQAAIDRRKFNILKFYIPAGRIDNYVNWQLNGRLDVVVNARIATPVLGAGPGLDYAAAAVQNSVQFNGESRIILRPPSISALTTTETADLNCITGLTDLDANNDIPGYPGADKMMFIGCDAGAGVTPNVLYTVNGGSTWAAFGADPFSADEHIKAIAVQFNSPTQYRLVVLRETADASNPPEIAYADITLGNESSSPTWNAVDVGSTNNDAGQSMFWPTELFNRLYVAAGGDIFVSTNQSESFGTAAYTGSTAINAWAIDEDENVWAVGASNLILREKADSRGTFETMVGPSGGGAMTAIAVADDDTIWVGNGSSLYRSSNSAASAGGWTSVKDFGTNHVVKSIQLIKNNSQLLKVVVSDTSGNEGDVWYSLDGNTFVEVTNVTNSGYNAAYFSAIDPNFAVVVGEDNGSTGVIHKVATA